MKWRKKTFKGSYSYKTRWNPGRCLKSEASSIMAKTLTSKNITKEAQNLCSSCNWQTPGQDYCRSINLSWMSICLRTFLTITEQCFWKLQSDVVDDFRTMVLKPLHQVQCPWGPQRTWCSQNEGAQILWKNSTDEKLVYCCCHSLEGCVLLCKVMTSLVTKSRSVLRRQPHIRWDVQVHRPGNRKHVHNLLVLEIPHLSRVKRKSDHSSSPHLT